MKLLERWNFGTFIFLNLGTLKLWSFGTKKLFYFQVRESPAPQETLLFSSKGISSTFQHRLPPLHPTTRPPSLRTNYKFRDILLIPKRGRSDFSKRLYWVTIFIASLVFLSLKILPHFRGAEDEHGNMEKLSARSWGSGGGGGPAPGARALSKLGLLIAQTIHRLMNELFISNFQNFKFPKFPIFIFSKFIFEILKSPKGTSKGYRYWKSRKGSQQPNKCLVSWKGFRKGFPTQPSKSSASSQ